MEGQLYTTASKKIDDYRFFCDPSRILQLSEFVQTLSSSVCIPFNNFLLINTTDRSNISSNQQSAIFSDDDDDVSLTPLPFLMNTPFKVMEISIVMVHGCRKTKKKLFGKVRKVMSYLILIFVKENWKPMSRLFMLCESKPEKKSIFLCFILSNQMLDPLPKTWGRGA